jgi:hypothetical protein
MKRLCLLPLLILVCFYSCKSPLENIDINNIEKHRAYQDSCINTTKDPVEQLKVTETLISEYRKMKIDEKKPNANYYYYLARLYSGVNDQSIYENCFFDKANNSIKNTTQFKNYYDSTYYFSEKCLSIDANNIKCASILAQTYFMEFARFMQTDKKDISNFPSVANEELLNKRFDYIINNTNRFIGIDTSTNKESSRRFTEVSLQFLDKFKLSKGLKFVANDINTTNILILAGNFIDYLSKFDKPFFVLKLSKQYLNELSQRYMPEISLAREELRKSEAEKQRLNKIRQIDKKYKNTFFTNTGGFKMGLVLYDDGTFAKGEVDYTDAGYRFTEVYNKGKWDVVGENKIVLHGFSSEDSDWKFSLLRDKFFGSDIYIIQANYKDGGLMENGEFKYTANYN